MGDQLIPTLTFRFEELLASLLDPLARPAEADPSLDTAEGLAQLLDRERERGRHVVVLTRSPSPRNPHHLDIIEGLRNSVSDGQATECT